jgi:hypothetical protein
VLGADSVSRTLEQLESALDAQGIALISKRTIGCNDLPAIPGKSRTFAARRRTKVQNPAVPPRGFAKLLDQLLAGKILHEELTVQIGF